MCLEVFVQLHRNNPKQIGSHRLESSSGLKLRKVKFEGRSALHVSTDGTSSCGFLSDEAEFEATTWSLSHQYLEPLANVVETPAEERVAFYFLARWLTGERPREIAFV